jgi:hypothetical protein
MKVNIKAVTAGKELTQDQKQILRRVALVLQEHNFSVQILTKVSKVKTLKIKRA